MGTHTYMHAGYTKMPPTTSQHRAKPTRRQAAHKSHESCCASAATHSMAIDMHTHTAFTHDHLQQNIVLFLLPTQHLLLKLLQCKASATGLFHTRDLRPWLACQPHAVPGHMCTGHESDHNPACLGFNACTQALQQQLTRQLPRCLFSIMRLCRNHHPACLSFDACTQAFINKYVSPATHYHPPAHGSPPTMPQLQGMHPCSPACDSSLCVKYRVALSPCQSPPTQLKQCSSVDKGHSTGLANQRPSMQPLSTHDITEGML